MRTYTPKASEITRAWHIIDATDVVLGRLASQTAILLRGKHKATYAPHVDTGDFVIIINAEKVQLTGDKRQEHFYWHTGYPGGIKSRTKAQILEGAHPERAQPPQRERQSDGPRLTGQTLHPVHGVLAHDGDNGVVRRDKSGKQGISPSGEATRARFRQHAPTLRTGPREQTAHLVA